MKTAKDIFHKMVGIASMEFLTDRFRRGKPGDILHLLTKEEREQLEGLTSKDLETVKYEGAVRRPEKQQTRVRGPITIKKKHDT